MAKSKKKKVSAAKKSMASAKVEMVGQNVGDLDKVVRVSIAVLLSALVILDWISGWYAVVAIAFAAAMVVTSATGVCFIYSMLGMSTCDVKKR